MFGSPCFIANWRPALVLMYKKVEQTFIVNVKTKKKKFYEYSFYDNAPLRKTWNVKIIIT